MKKRLLLPALAMLLVASATVWAVNDRDRPRNDPTTAPAKGPVRVDGPVAPPPGVDAPPGFPPGAPPQPGGGGPQPPGAPPGGGGPPGAGFGGQPPMGFMGGAPGQPPFQGGSKIDYKKVLPTLIATLDDDDGDVRRAVALTLARIGQPSVEPLLAVLKDKDKSKAARANAAYILGRIGSQARDAVPMLTEALKESDRDLRRRAAFALASVVGDYQGEMTFRGGMPGGMGMGGGRRGGGDELPDPGIVLPSHEKPSEKSDKPSEKPDKPK